MIRNTLFTGWLLALAGATGCGASVDGSAAPSGERADTSATRATLVNEEIEQFNAALDASDRAAKYCRMAESPYSFYRGSNHLFWRDFAGDSRFSRFSGPGTRVFLLGDAHARNYGSFDNDDGVIVYDLNDFDETVIADYQWDLWRMATSVVLVARENGFDTTAAHSFVDALTEAYLDAHAGYRGNSSELDQVVTVDNAYGRLDEFLAGVAASDSRGEMLKKWTDKTDGVRAFDLELPELGAPDAGVEADVRAAWSSYVATTAGSLASTGGYLDIKDIARRLDAGTGSLGTQRYYVLIEGASADTGDDRILDLKQQGRPSGYPYLTAAERGLTDRVASHAGQRAVVGYRALLANADDHLGWLSISSGEYSVRELSPYKEAFPTQELTTSVRFTKLAEQWGTILATAHARADKDFRADLIEYSVDREIDELTDTYHSEVRGLVRDVARSYATQVSADHQAFADYVASRGLCGQ